MLQKFLFIGVGGSGGKTLRVVREDLVSRLARVGWTDGFPSGWQFLYIDVPSIQEVGPSDLPPPLPPECYVGLVGKDARYRGIHSQILTRGTQVREEVASWQPNPEEVRVSIVDGAGQFRALGRMVGLAAVSKMTNAINGAVARIDTALARQELSALTAKFGQRARLEDAEQRPFVVVVASIAGGSGAGTVLDVCDLLRLHPRTKAWAEHTIAVLYSPDVFGELTEPDRRGVQANALATISELLNGYWHKGDVAQRELAPLYTGGAGPMLIDQRGPRYPYLVGSSNGAVDFAHQHDVFRVVGKALGSWAASAVVQERIRAEGSNWQSRASEPIELGLFGRNTEAPLAALGYATCGLGRDRFKTYSAERLAREAVDRLLRWHLSNTEQTNPDLALDEKATEAFRQFLDDAGLNERGPKSNQVLDALANPDLPNTLTEFKMDVARGVTAGRRSIAPRQAVTSIVERITAVADTKLKEQVVDQHERARAWVQTVQDRVLATTLDMVASRGLPVAIRLLQRTKEELEAVGQELSQEAAACRTRGADQRIHEDVANKLLTFGRDMTPENPLIVDGAHAGIARWWYRVEEHRQALAGELAVDLSHNYIAPLATALDRACERLRFAQQGSPGKPSVIEGWADEHVPDRLKPAPNEFLVDPIDTFPPEFERLVTKSVGAPSFRAAMTQAVTELIRGSTDPGVQTALELDPRWVPRSVDCRPISAMAPIGARFNVSLDQPGLLERAGKWVTRPDTPIADWVAETLQDYLDCEEDPPLYELRLERLLFGLSKAMTASGPLVSIDNPVLLEVHGKHEAEFSRIMTPIPLPQGSRARDLAREMLVGSFHIPETEVDEKFEDGQYDSIEISTFLASPYLPMVFKSLAGRITQDWATRSTTADSRWDFWQWRRSRPLPEAVPLPRGALRSMVRGWFTARLLNQIDWGVERDPGYIAIHVPARRGFVPFPKPPLGDLPRDFAELLPAIFESLPILLVDYAGRGSAGFAPYVRLFDLGTAADEGAVGHYNRVNPELKRWVLEGIPNGPTPRPEVAGSAGDSVEDRRRRALEYFAECETNWREIVEPVDVTALELPSIPRAWELRDQIFDALRELQKAISEVRTYAERPL